MGMTGEDMTRADINDGCAPMQKSQVVEQQDILDDRIGELSLQISVLVDRLSRVLTKPPLADKDKKENPRVASEDEIVVVAAKIRTVRYQIEDLVLKITDALERLQV